MALSSPDVILPPITCTTWYYYAPIYTVCFVRRTKPWYHGPGATRRALSNDRWKPGHRVPRPYYYAYLLRSLLQLLLVEECIDLIRWKNVRRFLPWFRNILEINVRVTWCICSALYFVRVPFSTGLLRHLECTSINIDSPHTRCMQIISKKW